MLAQGFGYRYAVFGHPQQKGNTLNLTKRFIQTTQWAVLLGLWLISVGPRSPVFAHRILDASGKPIPHWVRHPFEFQMCGISLGDKLLDRMAGNVIFRYALIRVHGMPDGLIIGRSATSAQLPPSGGGGGGAGGAGAGGGGMAGMGGGMGMGAGGPGGAGGAGGPGGTEGAGGGTQQFQQQEGSEGAALVAPPWAMAAWVVLDGNHVEWLYRHDTYVMGFMVDRLGFIDGIVVAGSSCPIARTQMGDPSHCIKLGDDARKVMYRYGFPDEMDTYVSSGSGLETASGVQLPGSATVTFRNVTNELRRSYLYKYHDSYNVIFTIQDDRVVRINIWGDPDYFTPQKRIQLRAEKY